MQSSEEWTTYEVNKACQKGKYKKNPSLNSSRPEISPILDRIMLAWPLPWLIILKKDQIVPICILPKYLKICQISMSKYFKIYISQYVQKLNVSKCIFDNICIKTYKNMPKSSNKIIFPREKNISSNFYDL